MKTSQRIPSRSSRLVVLVAIWFCVISIIINLAGVTPQTAAMFSQSVDTAKNSGQTQPTLQVTLAELGYAERTLTSPYDTAEYTWRLPEGWELLENSFFELDFSYTQEWIEAPEDDALPDFFGDLIVAIDGQSLQVTPVKESSLEHSRLRVALPPSLLNDPDRGRSHSVVITLDAKAMCGIPHQATLIVHSTSLFSLVYNQLPITADLSLYPRPFFQRAFEPDQVRFVLPARPTETELSGAMAIAAQLGNLTYGMTISGTTDLHLLDHLESEAELDEHLIVIGQPETNGMIQQLGQMDVLPLSLRERQLDLATMGPPAIAPASTLTYVLTLANTTQDVMSSLSLVNAMPPHTQLMDCSPMCAERVEGRDISWSVPPLKAGETISYVLQLRLSETITDGMLENTLVLLDEAFAPINVSTLTTTVDSALTSASENEPHSSASSKGDYFFVQGERAVPEYDGVVQEIVSPWDQRRAVLIVTGLSDGAVAKASRAMSSRNRFPGLEGSFALVQAIQSLPQVPIEPRGTDLTFADLGYGDRVLRGFLQETSYSFDLPSDWQLARSAYLELYFTHSRLIKYEDSFMSVLFNNTPIATIALSDETASNGYLKVGLPPSQTKLGQMNRISIQGTLPPIDVCVNMNNWLFVSSESRLHLDHKEQGTPNLDLNFYPYPFNQHSDLVDVLFALPPEPRPEEWEKTLQLAAALGRAAGGPNFAPAVAVGDTWSEVQMSDYHFIVLGRPSRNPVLQQINDQLPQPFLPGSDVIEQKLDEVVLRLPLGVSLGYVQLMPSPWNAERAFLAVTGTTDESVKWAADALLRQSWALKGDLVLIRNGEVDAIYTQGLTRGGKAVVASTAVPEMMPVATPTATTMITPTPLPPISTPSDSTSEKISTRSTQPRWLVPLVGVSGLLVIAILAIAFWQARRRRL